MTTSQDKSYCLLLNHLFFDTPLKAKTCLDLYPTKAEFLEKKEDVLLQWRFTEKTKERFYHILSHFNEQSALEKLQHHNIQTICITDPKYPNLLKEITDPPIVLYAKGNLSCLEDPKLAVVGARNASTYGKQVTEYLVKDLSSYVCIVSGLAKGIDTIAHDVTLQNNGKTIAVFGCSLDYIYPQENASLAEKILEKNGLLLSEFPITTEPAPHRFPIRNRIVSGLCKGVLVCEAGEKSGSLITAHSALDQNRDIFAVPGPIFSETSIGTHKLIQLGAKLVTSANDILEEVEPVLKFTPPLQKHKINTPKPLESQLSLTQNETLIVTHLNSGPHTIDTLLEHTSLPIHELLQHLTVLEVKGIVKQSPGKQYSL